MAWWVMACAGSGPALGPGLVDTTETSDTAAVPIDPLQVLEGPALAAFDPRVPLSRELLLTTNVATTVTVRWQVDERTFEGTYGVAVDHRIPLVGFAPDQVYDVSLTVVSALHAEPWTGEVAVDIAPLSRWPQVRLRTSEPAGMEPGDTLLGLSSSGTANWQVILDAQGTPLWILDTPLRLYGFELAADGNFIGVEPNGGDLLRVDWLGRVVRRIGPVHPEGWHHQAVQLPDGNILALSRELVDVPGYSVSYADPDLTADRTVLVDRVVELDPTDTVVDAWAVDEVLDVGRLGYDSLLERLGGLDWAHSNAVLVDPSDNGIVVSTRHQDTLFKIDRAGNLAWILSNPANWDPALESARLQPVGDVQWPYHQHAPELDAQGRLLVFDNAIEQASPWTGEVPLSPSEVASRLVEFQLDPGAGTVAQLWTFVPPDQRLTAGAMGDCDRMSQTGNILGLWGFTTHVDGVRNDALETGHERLRIIEVDRATDQGVFDLEMWSDLDDLDQGWNADSLQRIPTL